MNECFECWQNAKEAGEISESQHQQILTFYQELKDATVRSQVSYISTGFVGCGLLKTPVRHFDDGPPVNDVIIMMTNLGSRKGDDIRRSVAYLTRDEAEDMAHVILEGIGNG